MGTTGGRRFNGQRWYEKKINGRTKAALQLREEEFIQAHAADSLEMLAAYLRREAEELGHSPRAVEILGSYYIGSRFGSWAKALQAAGLSYPTGPSRLSLTRLYREEYERQQEIWRIEKEEKKELQKKEGEKRKAAGGRKKREDN
jgi:hypothetical protein